MNSHTFELELVQLEELFSKSRSNKFSDSRKNQFFRDLRNVFDKIESQDYKSFDIAEQREHRDMFDYLFNALEFLDTSTLNVIPFELVSCLEKALNDWVNSTDLIIMTSLSNRKADIWFQSWDKEFIKQIKNLIKGKYGLEIKHRLIRVSLPQSLSRDYLSAMVLYHELGHFVDAELNVTKKIYINKYGAFIIDHKDKLIFYNHMKEYFADLFAAQYVNNSSALYLSHLAYDAKDSNTHPATSKRNEVVNKFLKGESTDEIDLIQDALSKMGAEKLKIRHELFITEKSQMAKLLPEVFTNDRQLHGIYKLGWDVWMNSDKNFLKEFTRRQKYHVVNNLIEKTISNFNTTQNWNEVKSSIDG